jgi:GntR family transcriptional regulator/MocR family aminotransferase
MDRRATSGAGADLHLDLDPAAGGVRAALMAALRAAVSGGRLAPGVRLPSSRSLAADLGIARNTVAAAYAELVAEGWLTARRGSGTTVSTGVARRVAPRRPVPTGAARPRSTRPAHDLSPGHPDVAAFPRAAWLRATRRVLATAPDEAFGYGDPRGRIELRVALADYLARVRGVRAGPEQIVVCSGFSHALALLGPVLRARRVGAVAVESHGLARHRELLAGADLRTPALPVDEHGARTTDLVASTGVGAVLLTAAHQFPTGVALHPQRRAAAVDWARATGGLVLEDDYDGEFRYDRQPVGALQGLDPEHVVHLGTTSKSLAPGLRLGWMVLPERLVPDVQRLTDAVPTCGVVDQLVVAELLVSGEYDRHVRAMRVAYRRRRDQLVVAARSAGVRVTGLAAGLHAVVELASGTEDDVVRTAAQRGLAVPGMGAYRHPDAAPLPDALVVGYATPSASAWSGALAALRSALG